MFLDGDTDEKRDQCPHNSIQQECKTDFSGTAAKEMIGRLAGHATDDEVETGRWQKQGIPDGREPARHVRMISCRLDNSERRQRLTYKDR